MMVRHPFALGSVRPVRALLAAALALAAGPAAAFGPGDVTLDPQTGLEWLDVSQSAGRAYDDIVGLDGSDELTPGGDFAGFRYATSAEVEALLARAAFDLAAGSSPTNFEPALSLQLRLGGPTFVTGATENLFGMTETRSQGAGIQDRYLIGIDRAAGTGRGELNGGLAAGAANGTVGSFLVRDAAPLPERQAYVASFIGNAVTVIDVGTDTVVATIPVGTTPTALAVSPDQRRVYSANTGNDTVSVISTDTRTVIDTFDVGANPRDLVTSRDGSLLFVSHRSDPEVRVLETATGALVKTIAVDPFSYGITRSPDGARVYVCSPNTLRVTVIDVVTLAVVDQSQAGTCQFDLDVGSRTGRLYAPRSTTLRELDPTTLAQTQSVTVGLDTRGVAARERIDRVFTSSTDDAGVTVVDLPSFSVVTTIPTGPAGGIHGGSLAPDLAVTAEGDRVYVANGSDGTVTAIDTLSNQVVATIDVTGQPIDVVIVPEPTAGGLWAAGLVGLMGWVDRARRRRRA